jgi:hypothetical protein
MQCQYCDTELFESETVCPRCGKAVEEPQPTVEIVNEAPKKDKGKIFGIISLILGITGLVFYILGCCSCGIFFIYLIAPIIAIAGIVMGIIAVSLSKKSGYKNTMGIIGAILSGSTLVLPIIVIVCVVIFYILYAVLGIGAGVLDSMMHY